MNLAPHGQLKLSGILRLHKVFGATDQWHYSTEVRVLNTQLVYSMFFHLFDEWQTALIFGNITLYLALLTSYFFFCKRLKIARYFPLSAGILLLPLSAPYFYILLYGTYYIPR